MESRKLKRILELIAQKEHTTVDNVRAEMQAAMEEGRKAAILLLKRYGHPFRERVIN